MFFTRVASRKSTVGKSKVNRDHRRKLFFESLEDRRVLATIAYLSGHQLNASQLAAVGLTVTPNVNGYFPDNAGVASALASGAQAVVFGESVGTGSGLSAATKANIANYASGGGNVIVMGSHGGQSTFLNSVFGFSTGDGGFQLIHGERARHRTSEESAVRIHRATRRLRRLQRQGDDLHRHPRGVR